MEKVLKCKDFDAWVSFLGRLNKIGSDFVIKNDIIIPTIKGTKSGSHDKIPGRHLTRDPLFIDNDECYVKDGVYTSCYSLEEMIKIFKSIKENNPIARKQIVYIREPKGIYIKFAHMQKYQLFALLDPNYVDEEDIQRYELITRDLEWFSDYLSAPNEWLNITQEEIINLRNNHLMVLRQDLGDTNVWARIARSIFTMAGVTRLGVSFADNVDYTFLHSENIQKDTALLRVHATYKSPGGSKLIKVNCIHEYVVLIYDEGEE